MLSLGSSGWIGKVDSDIFEIDCQLLGVSNQAAVQYGCINISNSGLPLIKIRLHPHAQELRILSRFQRRASVTAWPLNGRSMSTQALDHEIKVAVVLLGKVIASNHA